MKTPLKNLTFTQYSLLLASGLMYEIYPKATGKYDKDVPGDTFELPKAIKNKIEIKKHVTTFICSFRGGWGMISDDLLMYLEHFRSGAMQGGGLHFSRRGQTRHEAFTSFFDEIKGHYIVSESKSAKDRRREVFRVGPDLTSLIYAPLV